MLHWMHPTADSALLPRRRLGLGHQGSRAEWRMPPKRRHGHRPHPFGCRINHGVAFTSQAGNAERLTSSPKGVDYKAIGHRYCVCPSGCNCDVRRVTMATNGEWKVLVDILYCVA